jgi:hypothetical protein
VTCKSTYRSISTPIHKGIIIILTFCFLPLIAQAENNPAADSCNMIYKHNLKYLGSSVTIDPNYRYVMEELVAILNANPEATVHIRGHVCCGPNKRISFNRARNVFKYFVREGISRHRISFAGYSDELPSAYPEKTEADEITNRRVDFVLNYKS